MSRTRSYVWRRRRTQTTFFRFSCSFRQQLPLQLCGKLSSTIEVAPAAEEAAAAAHVFFEHFFIIFLSLGFSLSTGCTKGRRKPSVTTGSALRLTQLWIFGCGPNHHYMHRRIELLSSCLQAFGCLLLLLLGKSI